jgi:hypothetical protein
VTIDLIGKGWIGGPYKKSHFDRFDPDIGPVSSFMSHLSVGRRRG